MAGLVKYDAACRAVAEAASIDEAKEFRDQSEAMRAYARQAKNKDMETKAAEIRFRAERRIGELMAAQREAGLMDRGGGDQKSDHRVAVKPSDAPISLDEAGIDKNLADRARKYAAIPQDEFNGIVDEWRENVEEENARVSVNLLAAGKKAEAGRQEPPAADDPHAATRKSLSGLTREGLEDEVLGLREENADLRKRVTKQTGEIADLKSQVKELTSDEETGRKIGNLQRRLSQSEGRSKEHQASAARLQRQANAQKAEIDKLKRQLESQEIPL